MGTLNLWYPENLDPEKREEFRGIIKQSLSLKYVGWDDAYDQQFDNRAVWFEQFEESSPNETLALCRLIFTEYGACAGPLPKAMGDHNPHTPVNGQMRVEASGFWYSKREHGIRVLAHVMEFLLKQQIEEGYLLFDPQNAFLRSLYLRTLALRLEPNVIVRFESFKRLSGEVVEWHVATGGPKEFDLALKTLKKMAAAIDLKRSRRAGADNQVGTPSK